MNNNIQIENENNNFLESNIPSNYKYKKNFWQSFNVLYEHIKEKEKEFSILIFIFSRLSEIFSNFSDEINDILNYKFSINTNFTCGNSIKYFLDNLKDLSSIFLILSVNIKNEIKSLEKNFLMLQKNNINYMNDKYTYTREFENELKKLDMIKNEFYQKISKSIRINLEIENIKKIKKEKKDKINDKKIKDKLNDLETSIKEAKESKQNYINELNNCENFRQDYINFINMLYDKFEKNEENLIKYIKISMNNYITCFKESIQHILNNEEIFIKSVSEINIENDIKKFSSENSSLGFPPLEIKYIEYSNDIPVDGENLKNLNINDISNFIKIFLKEKYESSNFYDTKVNSEIKNICYEIWDNKYDIKNIENIFTLFSNKSNMLYFLEFYNKIREEGLFVLKNENYEILGKCLEYLLNFNNKENNFEYIGKILVLGQTYYKNENEKKIYLSDYMKNNKLFNDCNFWINLTDYYVNSNFQNPRSKILNCVKELDESNKNELDSIAFAKASTIIINMVNYNTDIKIINEVIKLLCKKYKSLDKNYLNSILQTNLNEQNINFHENEEEDKLNIEKFEKKNKNEINIDNKINEIENVVKNKDNKEENNNENDKDN